MRAPDGVLPCMPGLPLRVSCVVRKRRIWRGRIASRQRATLPLQFSGHLSPPYHLLGHLPARSRSISWRFHYGGCDRSCSHEVCCPNPSPLSRLCNSAQISTATEPRRRIVERLRQSSGRVGAQWRRWSPLAVLERVVRESLSRGDEVIRDAAASVAPGDRLSGASCCGNARGTATDD